MAKHCIYCKTTIPDESILDVCNFCGIKVWGEKMFKAIQQNMQNAHTSGDLYQGSVSDELPIRQEKKNF